MTSMLALHNVSKTFATEAAEVRAVHDVSLEVKAGEFYSLLGPSGCGKTTTLRCIAGLETPDEGEILLNGGLVFSQSGNQVVPVHQRDIGMVFQSYAIWPHMNVFDNVAYPLRYGSSKRMPAKEIEDRVLEVLRIVHMEHLAKRSATQLSGGQQQRVALARALSRRPSIVLLDEPLSNLDAKLREEMRVELRDLLRHFGTTAIYVTHDQSEALAMSDRIAVMLDGRVVQEGTPQEIYTRPVHGFVAGFVGDINLLSGRVSSCAPEGGSVMETSIGLVHCLSTALAEGQEVKIAIRPESITVTRSIAENCHNKFRAQVIRVQFLGESLTVDIRVADQVLRVKMRPQHAVQTGESVFAMLPPESCLVMPNQQGAEMPR